MLSGSLTEEEGEKKERDESDTDEDGDVNDDLSWSPRHGQADDHRSGLHHGRSDVAL